MGIFSRFSDIINSNINALLDKAEDPEKMVRLIIQEMEETLVEVRTVSAKAIADKKELMRRKQTLLDQASMWESKAELALKKMRDDLAKGAIAEKLRLSQEAQDIELELQGVEHQLQDLEAEITQLQQKIGEAKARQQSLVARQQAAQTRLKAKKVVHTNARETLSKLEGYERKLDELEGQIESYDMGKKSLSEEIDQLAKEEEIEAQLNALKARLGDSIRDEK